MCEYAYLLSKASENLNGGFGIYYIADQKVNLEISTYNFEESLKICKFLI